MEGTNPEFDRLVASFKDGGSHNAESRAIIESMFVTLGREVMEDLHKLGLDADPDMVYTVTAQIMFLRCVYPDMDPTVVHKEILGREASARIYTDMKEMRQRRLDNEA